MSFVTGVQPSIPAVPSAPTPPESGRHLLGPHVVGQRVVVRRLLRGVTGPSGGPAFADLLGTCVAWEADHCVIRPDNTPEAEAVRVELADLVSGKPVPARTPPRLRVGVRDSELRTGSLWPHLERVPLGEWELRHDPAPVGRPRKRANSALAVGDPGVPVAEALAVVTAFYADRGASPLLQLEAGSTTEDAVRDAGWAPLDHGEAQLRIAGIAQVRRALGRRRGDVDLEVQGTLALASLGSGCDPLAEAQARLDGDWLGVFGLTVDPGHRRRGLAGDVLAELLDWGTEQGALTVWLHVETANDAGLAFWDALGLTPHHTCRYYSPAALTSR